MKKLFTFALAIVASLASFAQAPADWQIGENVAAKLGLGDVDGTSFSGNVGPNDDTNRPHDKVVKTMGDYWKVEGDMPNEFLENFDGHIGIYGFYDKKNADMYQVVKFPAGAYTIDVQALYREGTPADNFTNHFNKKYMKYGHLYADVLTSEDPASEVTRNFDRVLCSLATSGQTESVYYYGDGSWMNDFKYDKKDKETGEITSYYCPQCLVGLSEYFALDKYHNTMKIVLTEDSYIRLGFRKTGYIGADWLVFTNLQVIYDGPADNAAKVALAGEEFYASLSNLEDVQNDIESAGFNALGQLVSDAYMEAENAYNEAGDDVNKIVKVKNSVDASVDNFSTSLQFVKNLGNLISSCETMLETTEFPDKDLFEISFDKFKAIALTENSEDFGDDPAAYYQKVYNDLSKARADYLNSQPADENGAKDFTSLVKTPWFVDSKYNPTQNADGTWTLKEGGWADWGGVCGQFGSPKAYADISLGARDLTDICEGVVLYPSDDVTNEWYKANRYTEGWSAGVQLMWHSGLIGVSDGWNSLAVGTIGVEQRLVGLPNGYYSLKGLVRGNNGDKAWDGKNREIYAKNSSGEYVYSATVPNDSDRPICAQWGWGEWNPNAWADVETSIISALDGELTIGGRCSKVANFTGFRLFFYGESLDFSSKMQEYLDALAPELDNVVFAGDKKAVNDILNKIVFPIPDKDAYEVAFAYYNEAKSALNVALNGEKKYNAIETLQPLAEKYDFVQPAFNYAFKYGNSENDTYERVDELNEVANVYKTYCGVYDKATALNDATVNGIIQSQVAELNQGIKTADEMGAYLDALALPYNTAVINSNGGKDASPEKPANITSLLRNADLKEGPKTAWDLVTADPSCNSYGRHLAECWNQDPFTISQSLTSLPAGIYEFRVRALYRDGGAVDQAMIDRFNAANGDYEAWENHNAVIFANDAESYVKSVCDGQWTERSFDKWYNATGDALGDFQKAGFVKQSYNDNCCVLAEEWAHIEDWGIDTSDEDLMFAVQEMTPENPGGENIFDTQVGDNFYPCSTAGFMYRIQKSPEAYCNSVRVTLASSGDLKVGFRKNKKIDSDWLIYDDFELYYLGIDATAIKDVNAVNADAAIYNVAGQRVNENYKGVVIKNGKKFFNK